MSNLTKALAIVSLLAPMSAQPLGIGDIELHSALNQKLNAEIRLHLAAGENLADIKVRLAPPEKFDQAGIPWNYFLSKIKFQPVVQANGSTIIKVTSREVMTEPFLDFLLEVVWPQGSQFREFTVLIDPPADYRAPVVQTTAPSSYSIEPLEEYQAPIRKPRPVKKTIARPVSSSNITPRTPTSGEYGPIRTGDTLWQIADRLGNERNVPTNQMMMALFQANPEAFNNGDIDSLKAGVALKIPETDAILHGERKTASKAAAAAASSIQALELVAPTDAKVTDSSEIDGQVTPGQKIAETDTLSGTGDSATAGGKDIGLQTRIDRLEQQLNMMQQLLALKDQQLAALQSNDKATAQQAAESVQDLTSPLPPQEQPSTPATETQPTPTPQATVQQPATEPQKPAVAKPKPEPTKPKPVTPAPEEDLFSSPFYTFAVGGMGAGLLGLLGWLYWRKRKIEEQTNTDSMFASASQIKMPETDSSLSVPVMDINSTGSYDVGTVGESSFISDFTPSDFEAFDSDQSEVDPLSEADVYLAYGRYQQAEDLIRHAIKDQPEKNEYKLKLLEIFYANENEQGFAEYAQELADAGKNTDRPFWTKVSDMAKEIIPESALFGGTATALSQDQSAGQALENHAPPKTQATSEPAHFDIEDELDFGNDFSHDDVADLDITTPPHTDVMDDINSEPAELQLSSTEESETDENSLDFDLSSSTKKDSSSKPAASQDTISEIESIDFDLGDFSDDHSEATVAAEEKATDTLESFDFNFDLDTEESTPGNSTSVAGSEAAKQEAIDIARLDSLEFQGFDTLATEEKPDLLESKPEDTSSEDQDEFDFNFDFNLPSSENDDAGVDLGVADLTDMDEFETKIDLAKAYIDMGDASAARTIAEEVLKKGSPEQQQTAQAILDELK